MLSLTPGGQKVLASLRDRIARHETHVAGHLTPSERRRLRALLHELVYRA